MTLQKSAYQFLQETRASYVVTQIHKNTRQQVRNRANHQICGHRLQHLYLPGKPKMQRAYNHHMRKENPYALLIKQLIRRAIIEAYI